MEILIIINLTALIFAAILMLMIRFFNKENINVALEIHTAWCCINNNLYSLDT